MKTTEQALMIIQNDPLFVRVFDSFSTMVNQCIVDGFTYKGHPLTLSESGSRVYCDLMNFRNDLPMYLRNAGYQVNQFGSLFLAVGSLSFSAGTNVFSNLRDKICASIRRAVGYNESLSYPVDSVLLSLVANLIKPVQSKQ